MLEPRRPSLNNPAYRARNAYPQRRIGPVMTRTSTPKPIPLVSNIITRQTDSRPAHPKQQQSKVLHRQSVKSPHQIAVNYDPEYVELQQTLLKSKPKWKQLVFSVAGVSLLIGIAAMANLFIGNSQIKQAAVVGSEFVDEPANSTKVVEGRPTANALSGYSVPDDNPKIITIPKLYVYARIKPVSLSPTNQLGLTNNIFDVGWLSTSAKPVVADKTVMILNGHTSGPNQVGLFAKLKTLITGDTIKITRGDGQPINYTVVRVQNIEASNTDPNLLAMPAEPGKAGLNLIACNENLSTELGDCRQQVIIYATKTS